MSKADKALMELVKEITEELAEEGVTPDSLKQTVRTSLLEQIPDRLDDTNVDDIVEQKIQEAVKQFCETQEFRDLVVQYIRNDLQDTILEWVDETLSEVLYEKAQNRNRG
jgi:hypothetical protein